MWKSEFFFNDTATTEIYTLSLHDALPILINGCHQGCRSLSTGGVEVYRRTAILPFAAESVHKQRGEVLLKIGCTVSFHCHKSR